MAVDHVIHADWGASPKKRWKAEAHRIEGAWVASAPQRVLDPAALLESDEGRFVGFDFPLGLPLAYARRVGIENFLTALPEFGQGRWSNFYVPAESPDEINPFRPFYPHRPGGTRHEHLRAGVDVASWNQLRRECEQGHAHRTSAEVMFWTLGPKQVGRAAIAGWRDLIAPVLDQIRVWPFQGSLSELLGGDLVVCETYPSEFYGHLGLPRQKTAPARRGAATPLLAAARRIGVGLDSHLVDRITAGFEDDDAYDAFVGLIGMLNVVEGLRPEGSPSGDAVRRVEGWILGRAGAASHDGRRVEVLSDELRAPR
jgi:hypothetical protein